MIREVASFFTRQTSASGSQLLLLVFILDRLEFWPFDGRLQALTSGQTFSFIASSSA